MRRISLNNLQLGKNTLGFVAITILTPAFVDGKACGEGSDFPDGSVVITSLPFTDNGDTSDNTDFLDAVCPWPGSTSPDVFYQISGDLGEVTITTCESIYDTKTYILDSELQIIACDDDSCGETTTDTFPSRLQAKLKAGSTYYIAVDGYSGQSGEYTLTVDASEPPEPCELSCPEGGTQNDDPCDVTDGSDSNGGCADGVPYVPIAKNEVVCGSVWADDGDRDQDWYGYSHEGGTLNWTVECGAPCVAFIVTPEALCTTAFELLAVGDSNNETCGSAVASANLPPETYGMVVSIGGAGGVGIFEGYPCDSGFNFYTASVNSGPPPPPPCVTDFDGNGATDFQDLLQLLSNFGPCPE